MKSLVKCCFIALGLVAAGCASDPADHPVTGVRPDGTPKWVRQGSGAFETKDGKAFFGVGLVKGIQNPALSRQTADNRARGEVAKMFDVYITAMMKDYQRATTAGDFKNSAEEQDVVSVQKTITQVVLRGVTIKDHWRDAAGVEHALAILHMNSMMKSLDAARELNSRVKSHVRANARRAFRDLQIQLRNRRRGM